MKTRRICALVLAVLLAVRAPVPAYASRQDVEAAKKKASSLEEEKKKVETVLKELQGLKNDAAAYVEKLDKELEALTMELEDLAEQITVKAAEIQEAGRQLEEAKKTERKQYASMKLRIKYMYERGNTSLLDILFEAGSLVQLMNRAEYIQKISEYDKQKMDEYVATRELVAAHEETLRQEHENLLMLEEATEAKQQSVETLLAEKTRELKNFENRIDVAQGQISEYERDIRAQEERVKQLEAEIRRKEEEARKAAEAAGKSYKTVNLGDIRFTWPCPSSTRITSGFGARSSPTAGASSDHKGMDIGAATGSGIVAAAAGTVVIATYSYSAGNYVMINHGGGVYTVYMHCSQLLVKEGQQVNSGQTIAKVGSTGYSTGPHLHFGIRARGEYVDPARYVSP